MSKPIRVLHIVTQMNRAGMESRLMDLYRNIDKTKIQFDFYTCRDTKGSFDSEILGEGGRIFYNKPLSLGTATNIVTRFETFFNEHKEYEIIHCHLNQWSGLVLLGAKRAGVPIRIAHSRTSLDSYSIQNLIKNIVKYPVNSTATHKFAVSKKAGEWLFGKKEFEKGNVQIWPNAIDCYKFKFNNSIRQNIRKKLDIEEKFVLIHVGNLKPEKNHLFLLDVFYQIKKNKKNAVLLLVGTDHMKGKIQQYAKRLGLSRDIQFMGSRKDVHRILQAGDFFIFPSFYEGFPGALLEAQASGLPCLISDTITDEVLLTPTAFSMDLKHGPKSWANKIQSIKIPIRSKSAEYIKKQGYDIEETSQKLTRFYKSLNVD